MEMAKQPSLYSSRCSSLAYALNNVFVSACTRTYVYTCARLLSGRVHAFSTRAKLVLPFRHIGQVPHVEIPKGGYEWIILSLERVVPTVQMFVPCTAAQVEPA